MNRQARGLIFVIGCALLAAACAPFGVTSYTEREVLAPTQKIIEEAKTKADHEALAAFYQREAEPLHEKPSTTSRWPIRIDGAEVPTRCFTRPAMKLSRRSTKRPRKRI